MPQAALQAAMLGGDTQAQAVGALTKHHPCSWVLKWLQLCVIDPKEEKPSGELPKSKRRCVHWLESVTIHQDSAEMGLGNVFGNFIFLWPFVIIDRHRSNHSSQQEMAPDASCSSPWIALN